MPDLKTRALVLRRINYGESDRILVLLTEVGKISALAKGVRKEKSKLAGGIEMFSISTITLHEKAGDKDGLKILTSARLEVFYKNLLTDLDSLDLATNILKLASKLSDQIDSPEFFNLTAQALENLNTGEDKTLIEIWTKINLARLSGEEFNFIRDNAGTPLTPEKTYSWNSLDLCLEENPLGPIGANEIKFLRLLTSAPLATCLRIKDKTTLCQKIAGIVV